MKRALWLAIGFLGIILCLVAAYLIFVGWHARSLGFFVMFVGLMLALASYLYTPARASD